MAMGIKALALPLFTQTLLGHSLLPQNYLITGKTQEGYTYIVGVEQQVYSGSQ